MLEIRKVDLLLVRLPSADYPHCALHFRPRSQLGCTDRKVVHDSPSLESFCKKSNKVRSLIVLYHKIEEFRSRCSGDQDGVVVELKDEEASAWIP